MKLQISFDMTDLDSALSTAHHVASFAHILEVGTPLIYRYGVHAVELFRKQFADKIIFADAKIVDRAKEGVTLFSHAGADWISVMAGTSKHIVHQACTIASDQHKKIILDLLDTTSPGQIALEAKNIGASALLFHQPFEEAEAATFLDSWEMIRGNSPLPIFVSAQVTRENIDDIIALKPDTIIIGESITKAGDPVEQARYFSERIAQVG